MKLYLILYFGRTHAFELVNYNTKPLNTLNVNFNDESYNAVFWEWDIDGDGNVDYAEKNPIHIYETPGSYNVNLYVSNIYGNDTKVVENFINFPAHR